MWSGWRRLSPLRRQQKNMQNHSCTVQPTLSDIPPWDGPRDGTVQDHGSPSMLHLRLRALIAGSGRSLLSIARATGMNHATLQTWAAGIRHPRISSLGRVGAVERALGVPAGTLTSLVSRWPGRLRTRLTAHGQYLSERLRQKYLHRLRDWCPRAREEWMELFRLKTQSALSAHDPADDQTYWSEADGECHTARRYLGDIEAFYGWLIKFQKMCPRDMSLALFADVGLLLDYIEFRRASSFGTSISEQVPQILRLVGMLCRPRAGLLWREPGRFARHRRMRGRLPRHSETVSGARVRLWTTAGRWRELCEQVRRRVAMEQRRLRQLRLVRRSRTGDEILAAILDAPRPWAVLFLCERRMMSDPVPPTHSPLRRAIRFQRRLIFRLLVRYGFRRATLCRIRLEDIDHATGRFGLPKERFKNRRFIDETWRTTLPPSLLADLREFLSVHRPVMLGSRASERLLVCAGEDSPRNMMQAISNACFLLTNRYLPEWTTGLRPHAIRDIIATDIIMRDPIRGFDEAAVALWDRPETIRVRYAHLQKVDFQRRHEALADAASGHAAGPIAAAA